MIRPRRWAWGSAALLVAAALVAVVSPGLPLSGRASVADDPISVTVTPTDTLADGQAVTVTIKTTGDAVAAAQIQLCRDGVAYKTAHQAPPPGDFTLGGANCPLQPVSTSADQLIVVPGVNGTAGTPAGSITRYRVGLGTQVWTNPNDGSSNTLTCGPQDPCDLVVEVRDNVTGTWTPHATKVTFQDSDPIAGCGGPATGVLTSGGGDRMQDAWINWTLDHCHEQGQQGGASRAVFTGEGSAVNSFASGKLDFAYTAAGYGNEVGLLSAAAKASPRQAIAVPVAINAAVIAVAGGHTLQVNSDHVKVPYDDLSLTQQELASMLSGGSNNFQASSDLYHRNPQLNQNVFDTGISAGWLVGAPAEAESNSWFVTEQLLKNVPEAWKVPNLPVFGSDAAQPRGADAALALAAPSYAQSLTTLSGRPPLANAVAKVDSNPNTQGGIWVLTDLETADALGMTVVKIANQDGAFVPVDRASVLAGVASMKQTDNGLLLPDPKATAKVDGVTPYPLAYVEYALVPAEPLVTETKADGAVTCTARTDSQALLTGWLSYVTGAGQKKLPPGMFPITSDLARQAQTAIAQVGQAPVTGDCAGKGDLTAVTSTTTTTVAPTTSTTVAASSDGGSTGGTTGAPISRTSGGFVSRPSSAYRSVSVGSTPTAQPVSTPAATPDADVKLTSVPAFAGRRSVSWTGPLLALLGLTALSGLAAFMASERTWSSFGSLRGKP